MIYANDFFPYRSSIRRRFPNYELIKSNNKKSFSPDLGSPTRSRSLGDVFVCTPNIPKHEPLAPPATPTREIKTSKRETNADAVRLNGVRTRARRDAWPTYCARKTLSIYVKTFNLYTFERREEKTLSRTISVYRETCVRINRPDKHVIFEC